MRKNIFIFFLSAFSLLCGCKDAEMPVYDAPDGIQFEDKSAVNAKNAQNTKQGDIVVANFGLQAYGDSLLADTFVVYAQVQGRLLNQTRFVKLKALPVENAKMPDITFKDRYEVEPSTDISRLEVYVKRPADKRETYKTKIVFDVDGTDFVRGADELQELEIHVTDQVTLELLGGTKAQWQLMEEDDLGKYSEAKLRLLITALKTTSWATIRSLMYNWDTDAFLTIWKMVLAYNEANPDTPLKDEDGDLITFPWFEYIDYIL